MVKVNQVANILKTTKRWSISIISKASKNPMSLPRPFSVLQGSSLRTVDKEGILSSTSTASDRGSAHWQTSGEGTTILLLTESKVASWRVWATWSLWSSCCQCSRRNTWGSKRRAIYTRGPCVNATTPGSLEHTCAGFINGLNGLPNRHSFT